MVSLPQTEVDISDIPRSAVPDFWPYAAPLLAKAVQAAGGTHTLEAVRTELDSENYKLWIGWGDGPRFAAITQIIDYPGMRVLSVPFLGGVGRGDWMSKLKTVLKEYGRENGCKQAEAWMRRGFLEDPDWREQHVVARMDLWAG